MRRRRRENNKNEEEEEEEEGKKNFLQDLTRFFQKRRVIAKSRLTSNETC